MNTGFWEFGLQALMGFGLVNMFAVWMFTADTPPGLRTARPELKKMEEGIPMDGAILVTPKIKEESLVGV